MPTSTQHGLVESNYYCRVLDMDPVERSHVLRTYSTKRGYRRQSTEDAGYVARSLSDLRRFVSFFTIRKINTYRSTYLYKYTTQHTTPTLPTFEWIWHLCLHSRGDEGMHI